MNDVFSGLMLGLAVALTWQNLAYCLTGAVFGTLVGMLPGVGPVVTIALLLPVTFALEPASALIMLAGIFYGAQYGGSTTSILLNLPGESSSIITCIDGHAMAKQGRAGPALGIAAISSFVAGTLATLVVAGFAPVLTRVAIAIGPADYFALMVLGLVGAVVLAQGSLLKAFAMVVLGLILGMVGTDINSGAIRFAFGMPQFMDGIDFAVLAIGLFGVGEILASLHRGVNQGEIRSWGRIYPSRQDLARSAGAILRGTGFGTLLGVLPGGGPTLGAFTAYTVEKRLSRDPGRFGRGAIEGVAAPEAANNAAAQTAFIPMLTLGIPSNAVMALMIGAMMIHGITPGPQVMTLRPDLFWGVIASMWVGNVLLVVLNMPLIGLWVRVLRIPYRLLFPLILLFSAIGIYSLSSSPLDIALAAGFGVLGYVLGLLEYEPTPLLLGFVLGPMMEDNLRRAMILSRGDASTFLTQPVSAGLLALAGLLLVLTLLPAIRRQREQIFQEE